MSILDLVAQMDLVEAQKSRLIDVITNSCMTIASFKMLSNQQLMELGFPLPAILELMALIEKKSETAAITVTPLVVSNKENLVELPGPSSFYTPGKVAELTACEFKQRTSHIDCGTRAGLLQLNRFLVDEIVEVKVYI